jgi:hypothetical protein
MSSRPDFSIATVLTLSLIAKLSFDGLRMGYGMGVGNDGAKALPKTQVCHNWAFASFMISSLAGGKSSLFRSSWPG